MNNLLGAPLYSRLLTLTHIYKTRMERTVRDKQPNFLQTFVNYGCKKSYNIWPGPVTYNFQGGN